MGGKPQRANGAALPLTTSSRCGHSKLRRSKQGSEKEKPGCRAGLSYLHHSPEIVFARISLVRKIVKRGRKGATKWQSAQNCRVLLEGHTAGIGYMHVMGFPSPSQVPPNGT